VAFTWSSRLTVRPSLQPALNGCGLYLQPTFKTLRYIHMETDAKCPVTGKRKYETEGEALSTAAHQISTNNAPKTLKPYLCSYCQAWHLTKNEGQQPHSRRRNG
jgi:hypothetical protein